MGRKWFRLLLPPSREEGNFSVLTNSLIPSQEDSNLMLLFIEELTNFQNGLDNFQLVSKSKSHFPNVDLTLKGN